MKRNLLWKVLAVAMIAVAGMGVWPGRPGAAGPVRPRLAMIMPGVIQDADFNFVGFQALQEVKTVLGVEVAHSESVAVADAERVAREYLNAGFGVVAFHGGQYITIAQKLAPLFPDATIIIESSGQIPNLPPNVWNIGRKFYEGFYALGALAALTTKTNKIGFLSGIRLPDFIASLNAVFQATDRYNRSAEVIYAFVGDQNDPVRARQGAEAQIAAGVDFIIIVVNLGAVGVIEAARAARRPVLLTTFYTDKTSLAPQHFASSLLLNFQKPYVEVTRRIIRGERTGYYEMRPGAGMELLPPKNVPSEVTTRINEIFRAIVRREEKIEEVIDRIVERRR